MSAEIEENWSDPENTPNPKSQDSKNSHPENVNDQNNNNNDQSITQKSQLNGGQTVEDSSNFFNSIEQSVDNGEGMNDGNKDLSGNIGLSNWNADS